MKVKGLAWVGIKTDKFQDMERFLQDVMGLQQAYQAQDFVVFQLPNEDKVEVFGPQGPTSILHLIQSFVAFSLRISSNQGRSLCKLVSN
jgi:hypothetical protein